MASLYLILYIYIYAKHAFNTFDLLSQSGFHPEYSTHDVLIYTQPVPES